MLVIFNYTSYACLCWLFLIMLVMLVCIGYILFIYFFLFNTLMQPKAIKRLAMRPASRVKESEVS